MKHMKLAKPFIPYASACCVRKGFNRSICRTTEQKMSLQCLASAIPKSVILSAAKNCKVSEKKRKDLVVLAKTPQLNRVFQQNFQAATVKQWR